MADLELSAFSTPTVVVSLRGGLLLLEAKTEGCIFILRDYDACDPDQGEEEMEERRAGCEVVVDQDGEEYQLTRWGAEANVRDDVEVI